MIHEEVDNKLVALSIRTSKLTAQTLAKAMLLMLKQIKKQKLTNSNQDKQGKQSFKKLVKQGQGLSTVEITNSNIKSFERIARKYGITFALKKDITVIPPKWVVFFKSKDADVLTVAFKEFSAKTLKKSVAKPSLLETLEKTKKMITKNNIKNKTHGEREL